MEIKTILNRVQRHSLFVYGTVRWCRAVMRSQIDPMKKIARMLRGHRELLLNWFRAKSVLGQLDLGVLHFRLTLVYRSPPLARVTPSLNTRPVLRDNAIVFSKLRD